MCLSSSVTDHPLRPVTDRRLGEPLPHQLANTAYVLREKAGDLRALRYQMSLGRIS